MHTHTHFYRTGHIHCGSSNTSIPVNTHTRAHTCTHTHAHTHTHLYVHTRTYASCLTKKERTHTHLTRHIHLGSPSTPSQHRWSIWWPSQQGQRMCWPNLEHKLRQFLTGIISFTVHKECTAARYKLTDIISFTIHKEHNYYSHTAWYTFTVISHNNITFHSNALMYVSEHYLVKMLDLWVHVSTRVAGRADCFGRVCALQTLR